MKRALLLCLFLLLGTGQGAWAQVSLALKYPEGAWRTQQTIRFRQELTIAGMKIGTDAQTVISTRSEAGRRAADGSLRITETVEGITLDLTLPGNMKVAFDSRKPDSGKSDIPEIQAAVDSLRIMAGASYTVVLDKQNRLTAVEGTEKLLQAAPAASVAVLKQRLSVDALRQEYEEGRKSLPDRPVKKGDRWQQTTVSNVDATQTLKFETFYEYQGTVEKEGRTLDKIGVFVGSVTYETKPGEAPFKVLRSDLKVDSSTGTILFDRERGQIVESTSSTRITGPMTLEVMGMELNAGLDLTIDANAVLRK